MPAIQRSEFVLALNQVASERGVEVNVILETLKAAILAAFRKDHPGAITEDYVVDLNSENGEVKILLGGRDVTPPGFGRIATQTAKQVILQKIREAEKTAILSEFDQRIGTITSGMILRFDGPNIIIDLGKAEGVMPPQEQVKSENYRLNQRLTIYIAEIRKGMRGDEIIVSRAHPELVAGLLKREVPEVSQGGVIIKGIAREAGNRSKVAVFSNQSGIDPVGSCVGQKGVRVQAVIAELGGMEKIDIIQWNEDLGKFILAALAPAREMTVTVDESTKTAQVLIADEEQSLAIGREGQNVRLAAKLTGFKIEIKPKSSEIKKKPASTKVAAGKPVSRKKVKEKK